MQEYEILNNNKVLGKVKIYSDKYNSLNNSIIINNIDYKKIVLKHDNLQTYIINVVVDDIDFLYDIVSKYCNSDIYKEIDKIKKYNKIKNIKKGTNINLILDKKSLKIFNKKISDVNIESLIESKIYYVENVVNNIDLPIIKNKIDILKDNYYKKVSDSTYEFLLEEEKKSLLNNYNKCLNELIDYIDNNTNYKYGNDFVKSIKID